MIPHRVILAIFVTLLTQGNIVSALPQGSYQTRWEQLGGQHINSLTYTQDNTPQLQARSDTHEHTTTTADKTPITKRLTIPISVQNFAGGVEPRNVHDYAQFIGDVRSAITDSGIVYVGIPLTVLGAAYKALSEDNRTRALAWVSHIARSIVRKAPSPVSAGPDAVDMEHARHENADVTRSLRCTSPRWFGNDWSSCSSRGSIASKFACAWTCIG